jgi:hypothetical protein
MPRELIMSLVVAAKKKRDFDPKIFLATIGEGRKIVSVAKKQTIYAQGAACDAVFYIQTGCCRNQALALKTPFRVNECNRDFTPAIEHGRMA